MLNRDLEIGPRLPNDCQEKTEKPRPYLVPRYPPRRAASTLAQVAQRRFKHF